MRSGIGRIDGSFRGPGTEPSLDRRSPHSSGSARDPVPKAIRSAKPRISAPDPFEGAARAPQRFTYSPLQW